MAVTDEQLTELFFAESEELLATANEALLTAEAAGAPEESLSVLFRAFHSIKGGAMSLDLGELAELAHRLEDMLDMARQGTLTIDEHVVNLIFSAVDIMDGLLQSYSGKTCKTAVADSARLTLMDEIACVIAEKSAQAPAPEQAAVIGGGQASSIDPAKRLTYCEVLLAPDTEMAEIRMLLVLKRLEEIGQIVYSYPDQANLLVGSHADDRLLKAIIATDLDDAQAAKALDMANVIGCRVLDVATGGAQQAATLWPQLAAIDAFQQAVAQLAERLAAGGDREQMVLLSDKLLHWGEDEGMAEDWYPGGLQTWKGYTGLMVACIRLLPEQQDNAALLRQVKDGLNGLWQSVFLLLRDVRYYQVFEPKDAALATVLGEILSQILENDEVRLALLDLSGVRTLEERDVRAFVTACSLLANRGVKLAMFAGGQAGRRHHNVLEALSEATGGLAIWPTAFEAGWRRQVD